MRRRRPLAGLLRQEKPASLDRLGPVPGMPAFRPAEASQVKDAIAEMVDRFVADWRAVH